MSSKVLVTGAAGFIGSHLSQVLLARGDQVVGLDNMNAYYDPIRKQANVVEIRQTVADPSRFTFVEGDFRDRHLLAALFAEHGIEQVAHLGAMAGVRASIEDPYLYYDVNLNGTLALLDMAREHAVDNFVLASTSSVYGRTDRVPFTETDASDRPLAPYSASKRAAEMLAFTYHHLHGVNVTPLRFFTVYGPRGRPDMMAYKVLDSIFQGQKIPLFNGGQMYRDWTYVGDIVKGVVAALNRPLGYEIINLGRGEPVLLADFVHIIEELAGQRGHFVDEPMHPADVRYTYADISKAQAILGYKPQVSVREGVTNLWTWYQAAMLGDVGKPV
jgi:UDP-glucuronate 4-epimerase